MEEACPELLFLVRSSPGKPFSASSSPHQTLNALLAHSGQHMDSDAVSSTLGHSSFNDLCQDLLHQGGGTRWIPFLYLSSVTSLAQPRTLGPASALEPAQLLFFWFFWLSSAALPVSSQEKEMRSLFTSLRTWDISSFPGFVDDVHSQISFQKVWWGAVEGHNRTEVSASFPTVPFWS